MPSTLIERCMLDCESRHASVPLYHLILYHLHYLLNPPRLFAGMASYVHYLLIAKHRTSLSAENGRRGRAQEELTVPSQRLHFQEGQDSSCHQATCAAPRISSKYSQASAFGQRKWRRWKPVAPRDGAVSKFARLQHLANHYGAVSN